MAHLFRQMYVDEIDYELFTPEKLIDFVFTEMVYRQIQKLEEETRINQDEIDGNQWSRFGQQVEVLDEEERWVNYAERALAMLNHEVMWKAIVEACKILKYPEPSETQRNYFETLFDMSCFLWHQMYSESERTVPLSNLIDYISYVCKLKYNSTM